MLRAKDLSRKALEAIVNSIQEETYLSSDKNGIFIWDTQKDDCFEFVREILENYHLNPTEVQVFNQIDPDDIERNVVFNETENNETENMGS